MTDSSPGSDSPRDSPGASEKRSRRIAWRSLVVILAGVAAAFVAVRWRFHDDNAVKFLATSAVCAAGVLALAMWGIFGTGLRRRTSWLLLAGGAVGFACLVVGARWFIRIEGFSGDMRPEFRWTWSKRLNKLPEVGAATNSEALVARLAGVTATDAESGDYPRFLGPRRQAVVDNVRLDRDWSRRPPREVWRRPIGVGWSAFAVAAGVAITQEQRGEEQLMVCYDRLSGRAVWHHVTSRSFVNVLGGDGPRATPTIGRGRVFCVDANGILNSLDAATGTPVWPPRDTLGDTESRNLEWGKSNSPLLVDDLVICTGGKGGQSLIAYRQATGEIAWTAGDDKVSYSSPTLATLGGRRQVLVVYAHSVAGHDPQDGRLLWRFDWPGGDPKASQPVPLADDRVFVSAGYGLGCVMLQIEREADGSLAARSLWANRNMKTKFSNVVLRGDYAYGLDDGILTCLDLKAGSRTWKRGRFGHGQILLAGDVLLVLAEDGQLAMIEASPERFTLLHSVQALTGKTWNNLALAGRYLYLRNAKEAVCYELALDESAAGTSSSTSESR